MARLLLAALFFFGGAAQAKQLLTMDEALSAAFPGCAPKAETHYLSAAQVAKATELAGSSISSAIVIRQVVTCPGRAGGAPAIVGYAYTDTHRVRTLPETVLVIIDPAGKLKRIEVLSFDEPMDYLPRAEWYKVFSGHALDSELALKRGIPSVTGASLTSRATTEAARRALALHGVIGAK